MKSCVYFIFLFLLTLKLTGQNPDALHVSYEASWPFCLKGKITSLPDSDIFLAASGGGVLMLKPEDGELILKSDHIRVENVVYDICYNDDHEFLAVAGGNSGLQLWNVKQTPPQLITVMPNIGSAVQVKTYGDFLYVAEMEGSLKIVDITTPASPQVVYTFNDLPQPFSAFTASSSHLYVGGGKELFAYDIQSPSSPSLVGSAEINSNASVYFDSFLLHNNELITTYKLMSSHQIQKYDISNPANITETESMSIPHGLTDLTIDNQERLYIALGIDGIKVYDVNTFNQLTQITYFTSQSLHVNDTLMLTGNVPYMPNYLSDFSLFSVDMEEESYLYLDNYPMPAQGVRLKKKSDFLLWSTKEGGIFVLDASDPMNINSLSWIDPGTFSLSADIHLDSSWIFTGTDQGIGMYDISDISAPVQMDSESVSAWVNEIEIRGNTLYVAADGFIRYNVEAPNYIEETGYIEMEEDVEDFLIMDTIAYVGLESYNGFKVVSLNDFKVKRTLRYGANEIVVKGDYAYLADHRSQEVVILNISRNNVPYVETVIPSWRLKDIALLGDKLFAACVDSGVIVYDVQDPQNPYRAGHYKFNNHTHWSESVEAGDDYVYSGTRFDGIQVLKYDADVSGLIPVSNSQYFELEAFPNPFSDEVTIILSGIVNPQYLEIYDISGSRLRKISLSEMKLPMKEYRLNFKGMQEGTYIARIQTESGKLFACKMVYIK